MDTVETKALQDLAKLFVDQELAPLLTDLIAGLPTTYAPIVGIIEAAVLPGIVSALDAAITKL